MKKLLIICVCWFAGVASAGTNERYSDDTEGGFLITLQEANTPKSGVFYFKTDSATTAAQYESLKTAAA